jgi:hypothetical protein
MKVDLALRSLGSEIWSFGIDAQRHADLLNSLCLQLTPQASCGKRLFRLRLGSCPAEREFGLFPERGLPAQTGLQSG